MTDLSTLLSRVESGSGADWELDAEVAAALYQLKDWRPACRPSSRRGFIVISYVDRDGRRTSGTQLAPAYTTDLNAVVALVEARAGYNAAHKMLLAIMNEALFCISDPIGPQLCRHLLAALIRAEMEKVK